MNVKILKAYKKLRKGQMFKMSHFVPMVYKGRKVVGIVLKVKENSKSPVMKTIPIELAEFLPDELTFTHL